MLLNSETAVTAAENALHDLKEFYSKWPLLTAPAEEVPEGFVDFEFSDGALLRVPCVWKVIGMSEGEIRSSLIFRRDGVSAEWKPGTESSAIGAIEGMLSDHPIKAGTLTLESLISRQDWMQLADAIIGQLNATKASISGGAIDEMESAGASMSGCTYADLSPSGSGHVDADLSAAHCDRMVARMMTIWREKISPILKMNAFNSKSGALPTTDAVYEECIPLLPLSENATPINGFNASLDANPFYPDWFYVYDAPTPWVPDTAWVPSYARPSEPWWQDADGVFWHEARVFTNASRFNLPNMAYPPRCRVEAAKVLPPVKFAADGLIVTVKNLSDKAVSVCVSDRYVRQADGAWEWSPGTLLNIRGNGISQFILKRRFTVSSGEITAFEYQFLPLGEIDGSN